MSDYANVDYVLLSPNYSRDRQTVDRLTPHHTAGLNPTALDIAKQFATKARGASCNYGIGNDGSSALIVNEANRAWTSSSPANDRRSITFEISNSSYGEPWAISDAAYEKFITIAADIAVRYGKNEVISIQDKINTLAQNQRATYANNYIVPEGKLLLTQHNYFAATQCPGTTIKNRWNEIVRDINKLIPGYVPGPSPQPIMQIAVPTLSKALNGNHYSVQVQILQNNLVAAGITVKGGCDGWFGNNTRSAVIAFQKMVFPNEPIEWDGVYGQKTYLKMLAKLSK